MNQQVQLRPSRSEPTEDAQPRAVDLRLVVQAAIVGIFLLLFIAFLELGRAILLPVVSAVIIGMVLEPLSQRAESFHVPRLAFATTIVAFVVAAAYLGFLVLSQPIVEAVSAAPQLGAAIRDRFQELQENYAVVRYLQGVMADGQPKLNIDYANLIKPALVFLTPAVGQLAVFAAVLFLFLIDQHRLRHRLILIFPNHDARLRAIRVVNDIHEGLVRYIGAVTIINFGVGIATWLILYLLQFPNPIFWGVAAFICNFMPYIGPTLIVIALSLVGLVTYPTIGQTILAPGLFIALTTIEGHFVTPNVIGHNFRTSALAAFLSLAFWTWLWGPIGAFLSLPLLIIGVAIVRQLLPEKGPDLPA